ncbi:hypothetical protein ABT270_08950 [Streptomyces sp900105245]|uniref:hypothetical protein n=1 Tax=Streptomyces sp. 900105245 TaxID=3154379 RepID=UPI0033206B58
MQRDANPISADDGRQALTGDGKFSPASSAARTPTWGFPVSSGLVCTGADLRGGGPCPLAPVSPGSTTNNL